MRALLKKIVEILDGTPAVYGKKRRGQSTVELALVSPLLVILLAGMVEIGWFARNYLVLLEVTRVGARAGAVQQNETSPLDWDDRGSIVGSINPIVTGSPPEMPATEWQSIYRFCNFNPGSPAKPGFYNALYCIMERSMDPLVFQWGLDPDGDPYPDDVVISAFALQAVDPAEITNSTVRSGITYPLLRDANGANDGQPQTIVVGRWPENANECQRNAGGGDIAAGIDGRDPFDWVSDGVRTLHWNNGGIPSADREDRHYLELVAPDSTIERQRGFAWQGQHQIEGTGCLGSEWDIAEVEDLANLVQFNLTDNSRRQYLPSQGLVLVEMWWQHESISQFVGLAPVISPVFGMLGADTTVSVWAAFPLPQVEPRIDFVQ